MSEPSTEARSVVVERELRIRRKRSGARSLSRT